ncbi:putative membrane protein [Novosphingobium chloroacetimidivorans]|uniref:Putative membrane protein n=1 Tax=Novosphingobium chloroacetimidivorans TaxID=1428314 RepID=A0A7W7KC82_9SPHN|nr:DUF2339 domain-containing protein [Novosphingobium chloroacetimidivorans]MBB4860157.1 putative membrane protein [Novosphingobium chloroacetimidivorans]
MTGILMLATMVMGALLYDARRRLKALEGWAHSLREEAAAMAPEPMALQPRPAPPEPPLEFVSPRPEPRAAPTPPRLEPKVEPIAPRAERVRSRLAGIGFEDLFGRKLPIWAGGLTLIVAAVLLVKYSIDSGLLSPGVRVVLGLLFGGAMIVMAEVARHREAAIRDPRVAQALAGAGVGALYAAVLAAANLYALVGPGTAFVGLAMVTALALALALRFGAPCAVLGLVGGLAAPALVQSDSPSVPLLAGYLALVIGAITLLSRRQRWIWLGLSALVGGAGWSLFTIAIGGLDAGATVSMGLLVVLLALGLPALTLDGRAAPLLRAGAAVVGAVQLAVLVANGNFAPLTWGLYGLLSLAYVWLANRTPTLQRTVAVPLLTAIGLAAGWPGPDLGLFAAVIAGTTLIFGGYALRHLWREGTRFDEVGLLCAAGLGSYAISLLQFYEGMAGQDVRFAMLGLLFALVPASGVALGWNKAARHHDARFALLASGAGVLVAVAGLIGLPGWSAPIAIAAVAACLLGLSIAARDPRVLLGGLGFVAASVFALVVTGAGELDRLFEIANAPHPGHAVLRWGALALVAAGYAWRSAGASLRLALQPLAVLLGYGLVAQVVPAPWLAVASAAGLLLLAEAYRRTPMLRLQSALATLAALLVLWTLEPLARWLGAALFSLAADPVLVTDLPALDMAMRQLLVPGIAALFAVWRLSERLPTLTFKVGAAVAGAIALVSVHVLYKQLFAMADRTAFVEHGLAERCLWEIGLLAAAYALWRWLEQGRAALALIAAALGHGVTYTVVLHDPLWAEQAVGRWPLVNWLIPAFGLVPAALVLAERIAPERMIRLRRPADALRMATVLLFAFATLRQLFAGSVLVHASIGEGESILWSVLAIGLAVGFLVHGIRRGGRDWRLVSLGLMLVAVAKVFLLDASGLEGLLRIASFLALGFSLIGVGWLYSRYLKPMVKEAA